MDLQSLSGNELEQLSQIFMVDEIIVISSSSSLGNSLVYSSLNAIIGNAVIATVADCR